MKLTTVDVVTVNSSILEPPLDDNFAFREEVDCFSTLTVQSSEEGVFHSAEWEECHWCHYTYVNSDVATLNSVLKLARPFSIRREDRSGVSERIRVDHVNRGIEVSRFHYVSYRTKYLFFSYSHVCCDVFKN